MKEEKVYELNEYLVGFTFKDEQYHCLYCEAVFNEGQIYPYADKLFTAKKMIQQHLEKKHQGPLMALLSLTKNKTGLTDSQHELLHLFAQDLTDTIIAQRLGISTSTVRNHRFKLKEKERQAKVFLSIMQLLGHNDIVLPHPGATMLDDRYQINAAEREKVLASYFDENGFISQFPRKEKRKIIVLSALIQDFDHKKNYSEHGVNEILKRRITDFVTVRRYLIEYGFMQRTNDGKSYWVTVS